MKDVLIVGGGPAGSALAVQLGLRGLTVDLLDQAHFPREKPCGEGILPPGVAILQNLGISDSLFGQRLQGVRYHVGDRNVRAAFGKEADGSDRVGLGVRRHVLDSALWEAASNTPGVDVHPGVSVQRALVEQGRAVGVIANSAERRARWVVGADGASSALRRALKLERVEQPERVGVRVHFGDVAANEALVDIQVFLRPGYEIYVTPLPGGQLLVAALALQQNANHIRRNFWTWCAKEPLLRGWLLGARQISPLMGRAALRRRLAPGPLPQGLTFIGDAAASVDPITAGGITLALKDAEILAETLPEMIQGSRLAQRRFARAQDAERRTHRLLGGGLLALSEKPRAAEQACRLLDTFPAAMNALVGLAAR